MAFKNFKLDADMNLTLRIPAGAEFEPVTLRRRTLLDNADVSEFRREATRTCRNACSKVACTALVYIDAVPTGILGAKEPEKARLYCTTTDCPLNEPPVNDNEPLAPAPPPPSLQAEAPILV